MMTDKEKLTALIDHYAGGSQSRFAELIGVPRSNVATWMHRGSITANGREAILDAFPQVDRDWLAEGGAEVEEWDGVPQTIHFSRADVVPYFEDCRASCGVVEQFDRPELATDFVHVPGARAMAAVPADGVSMEPTIHDGDICLVGPEVALGDVNPRSIYLVVTRDGMCMFKRIYDEGAQSDRIVVLSENPDYVPHAKAVMKEDVVRVYPLQFVVKKMS